MNSGSHNVTLERNTAYDINGHCFYLEDGIEEENIIQYNAVAHVKPIGRAAKGACTGEYVCSGCNSSWLESSFSNANADHYIFDTTTLANPADVAASAFYVTNNFNTFIGNS